MSSLFCLHFTHILLHSAASEVKNTPKPKQGKRRKETEVNQLLLSALRNSHAQLVTAHLLALRI